LKRADCSTHIHNQLSHVALSDKEQRRKGRQIMKRMLIIAGLLVAGVGAVYAASCTEGGIKITGETCAVIDGHCACTGNGN